jgi:hypothetical protein
MTDDVEWGAREQNNKTARISKHLFNSYHYKAKTSL